MLSHKKKHMRLAALTGIATIILSGCTMYTPSYGPTITRNKITVADTVERLEIFAGPAGLHLSARDQDAVGNFIAQYARSGQGPLYMNIPGNAGGSQGVVQAREIIRAQMFDQGIEGARVQVGQYLAPMGVSAPVIVSFRRLTTAPINCHQGASLTHISNNQPYGNFGCAQTANLAAMIDNPRQLLAPYDFDNPPALRRTTVLQKYMDGEATQTPRPDGQEISAGNGGSNTGGG